MQPRIKRKTEITCNECTNCWIFNETLTGFSADNDETKLKSFYQYEF